MHSTRWIDTPNHTQRDENEDVFPCPQRAPLDTHFSPYWNKYDVEYHHVQMALKLHRFNLTFLHRHYLELLLATHVDSVSINLPPRDETFRVESRVIKVRYLRKSVWMFRHRARVFALYYADLGDVQACCHLSNVMLDGGVPLPRLENAITRCLRSQRKVIVFCRECATEVELSYWTGINPWLCMVTYQDLGTEDDVPGDNWRAAHWDDEFTKTFKAFSIRKLWGDSDPSIFELFID